LVRRVVAVPIPGAHEVPADPSALAAIARALGFPAEPAGDVQSALRILQQAQKEPYRVLICGSLYLAGHVLALQEGVRAQMN
jgi:dihydrofolate synthase/folylpolyglutamate synthase